MPSTDPAALAALRAVESELDTRWPENKIVKGLDRISALVHLLGDPQRTYPVLHIAGTNGKTSTSRMLDALLTRLGLRTGRYTSPHLQLATERISVDGGPISPELYVSTYREVEPYVSMLDDRERAEGRPPLTKFEVLTAMAFAAFADAPVEAAVVEVGMGGSWDTTNVADGRVAVICPIGVDHVEFLGSDIAGIAGEKAGIIKPGAIAVMGEQVPEAARVVLERCADVDATVARQGSEFGVLEREIAVGGQRLALQGLGGVYDEIFLPLHGAHQARNASLALAAAEAFFGAGAQKQLAIDPVREAFASVTTPGRLERVRSAPTVLVDAAHNEHGARALATALQDEFHFRRLVGVVGVLAGKDARGILAALEPVVAEIVLTTNSSPRALDPDELAGIAKEVVGEDRIVVEPRLADAIETAVHLAERTEDPEEPVAGAGVVVTGSVVTAGDARALFGKEPE
ncbi:bifunctional tetrahydrofolate synthase/dihydrofolate synthase [Gandjariella thermophila]|uniref:Dihydrofolate synthase/folylpolyglutamate synthase n=1 Tax=Gandjariella thermophila TaxID=1931992 RepID=A0A4D4J8C9_9PSEU|nr:folylpolyglutamate synthase/dihydrofolate synthase family protein [Gandjariella thermophila]GDY31482.1 dihydrofolate synthase [Gandjariella thermophila]